MMRTPCRAGAVLAPTLLLGCAMVYVPWFTAASAEQRETNDVPRVVLDLADESHILGTLSASSISIQTAYAGLDVPIERISGIAFQDDGKTVSVTLRNNDKLTGILKIRKFDLDTIFGKVSIGVEQISKIAIRSGKASEIEGLVAYYPFNGNADDESGNKNNGIVHGATLAADRFDNPRSAYSFDGVDDYIEIPGNPGLKLEHLAVSAWIQPVDITSERYKEIIRKDDPHGGACYLLSFQESGSQLTFGISAAGEAVNETDTPVDPAYFTDAKWHHIAGTFDGKSVKLYVDGALKGAVQYTGTVTASDSPIVIGKYSSGNSEHFNGRIDDVRIYNTALTPLQIKEEYQRQQNR